MAGRDRTPAAVLALIIAAGAAVPLLALIVGVVYLVAQVLTL